MKRQGDELDYAGVRLAEGGLTQPERRTNEI